MIIAVEEVWNKFLLSPLELARYVDEFDSPWLKAYFDVGNVVFYGYPQDWIRTLAGRIVKVHLKDFQLDRPNGRFTWRNIGDGDIDWLAVHRAFADIGYRGDIFIFPVRKFIEAVHCGIASGDRRKIYISRLRDNPELWVLRRANQFAAVTADVCLDVSQYRRNFSALLGET